MRAPLILVPCLVLMAAAQAPSNRMDDWCTEAYKDRRVRHCEERADTLTPGPELDVDPGRNGGIQVRGWNEAGLRLRTRITAYALTEARARQLAAAVRIGTVGGRIRSDGPMTSGDEYWGTSFLLDVPRGTRLSLNTENGGISLEAFGGTANLRTINGGISLRDVGGDVKGYARNGGLRIELTGQRWDGAGLDVETRNGGIRLSLPAGYSAELETGTVNGGVNIDFPVMIHSGRQRRFTTTLGSGGPKIRVVTTNGGVSVRVAGAPAPGSAFP
jgi:hypothetical protein